jgi:hypothetical protein
LSPPRKGRPRSQSPISKKSKAKTGSSKRIIASDEKKQSKSVKNSKTKGKHSDENISEKLEARKKKFESAKVVESENAAKKISLKGIVQKSKKPKVKDNTSKKKIENVSKSTKNESVSSSMNETKSNQKSPHTEKKLKSEKISTKLTPKKRRNSSTDKRIETKRKVTPKKLDSESESESSSDNLLSDSDSDSDSQTWRNKKSRKSERMKEDIERERRQRLQQQRTFSHDRRTSRDDEANSGRKKFFDNKRGNIRREDRFKEHKNKIFVAMSDDEEDTGRSYRNFSDTSHKKYDSRKSYFDSEKLGDGKSLKIEIKSRSDQSGSDKKRTHMHSVDDVTTEVSKKGKDFNKKRSEKDDSHSVVVTVSTSKYRYTIIVIIEI